MLIVVTSNRETEALKALDTLTTGLAFERRMDLIFACHTTVTAALSAKIALATQMGLKNIYILDSNKKLSTTGPFSELAHPISAAIFREICEQHIAIVSF